MSPTEAGILLVLILLLRALVAPLYLIGSAERRRNPANLFPPDGLSLESTPHQSARASSTPMAK